MRKRKIIFILTLLSGSYPYLFSQEWSVIPMPAEMKAVNSGTYEIKSGAVAEYDPRAENSATCLSVYCAEYYGISIEAKPFLESRPHYSSISLVFDKNMTAGQYTLTVASDGITIRGSEDGLFYGIQTLIQLMPVAGPGLKGTLYIPFVEIRDQPRFAYRGMLLDVSRHFFPVDFLKKCIDFAACHKMNYFQLHLTDDQGWRIEIKKYPLLNQRGSWRNGTMKGLWPGTGNDSIRHGGYYTQEQLRDLVEYAGKKYITIVPEIEMPGHALAALASYPYLGCTGGPYKVKETWGAAGDVFCAGKDSTFEFLQDVLDEVLEIFPSQYIHIGGDECQKDRWKKCDACQERMKAEKLKNEAELQNYFITRIANYLGKKGRIIIGWDEILEGGIPPGAVIMSWRGNGEQGCIGAVHARHPVILSPSYGFYLDYPQTSHEDSLAAAWGGVTTLRKTYDYEPVNDRIKPEEAAFIQGGQTAIWTEYINNISKVEYMAFPRLSAVSEVLWTPREKRDWKSFTQRLNGQYDRYRMMGIKYNPADPDSE